MSLNRCTILLWLLFLLKFLPVLTTGMQNLNLSSRLIVGETLVSPSGYFELGIFLLQPEKYYLCIRYAEPIGQVVVWVANREVSLSVNSYLELSNPNGNLLLSDPAYNGPPPLWSSNTTNAGVDQAVLNDTGNLVLLDNKGKPLWDSFKNSSIIDTLLPGQIFYKSDNRNITSWKAEGDPSNGFYTFGWGTRANASILQLAWTSPRKFMNWTGGIYIPAPDAENPHTISNVSYVYFDDTLGNLYFPSSPADTVMLPGGKPLSTTTLKRITLDTDGGLRIWQWIVNSGQEKWTPVANWVVNERNSQCFAIGACGSFSLCQMSPPDSVDRVQCTCPEGFRPLSNNDATGGCTPIVPLDNSPSCNATKVNIMEMNGIDMPWGGDYKNLTGADSVNCKPECLKDCQCAGAVYSMKETQCWMKMSPLYNLGYPTATLHGKDRTAFVKISKDQPVTGHKKVNLWAIIGGALGGILVAGICIFCVCKYRDRLRQNCGKMRSRSISQNDEFVFKGNHDDPPVPMRVPVQGLGSE